MEDIISAALTKLGLGTLIESFKNETIEADMVAALSDGELSRLGLCTIGSRMNFKKTIHELQRVPDIPIQTHDSLRREISRERATLFGSYTRSDHVNQRRSSSHSRIYNRNKKKLGKTWIMQFYCLADNNQAHIPTATEKEILNKAGLGTKKIVLNSEDDEKEVFEKIMSNDTNHESHETAGFPQLRGIGFELMRCTQNCRKLKIISCRWSASELRKNVNPQANIYIRPIQNNLSTKPLVELDRGNTSDTIRIQCAACKIEFPLHELRSHTEMCHILDTATTTMNQATTTTIEATTTTIQETTTPSSAVIPDSDQIAETIYYVIDQPMAPTPSVLPDLESNLEELEEVRIEADLPLEVDLPLSVQGIAKNAVEYCEIHNITDPIEILAKLQQDIVTGRPLEIENPNECEQGDTNFIIIDREAVLRTGLDELKFITAHDLRNTIEVQFYDEMAQDYGGPRKEFFRLLLRALKEKYFDHGMRELLCSDYELVGKAFALSILQNGSIPHFMSPDVLEELFESSTPSACIIHMRAGLNSLGIMEVCLRLPSFRFLFHPSNTGLTMKMLAVLLKPQFSEEGTNHLTREKAVYGVFVKYLREVASGRRGNTTLSKVLEFVTGTDEEPVLGFKVHPAIIFHDKFESYLPTANTCTNMLNLPKSPLLEDLPNIDNMFDLYDYAFANTFYGLK